MNPLTFPSAEPEHIVEAMRPAWVWIYRKGFKHLRAFTHWVIAFEQGPVDLEWPSKCFYQVLRAKEIPW